MNPSYDRHFWQLREMQRTLAFLEPHLKMIESVPPSVLDHIEELTVLRNNFALPPYYLDAVDRAQEGLKASPSLDQFDALGSSQAQFIEDFRWRQNDLEMLSQEVLKIVGDLSFDPPEQRIIESLIPIEALHSSVQLNDQLLHIATLPQQAFQEFSSRQLKLAAGTTSDIARMNLLSIVDSAADLLDNMNSGLRLAVLMDKTFAKTVLPIDHPVPIKVNVYVELKKDLGSINLEDPELDAEEAVTSSNAAQITELGKQIIQLVYDLNTEAERENGAPIFKPTTKTGLACSIIPTCIATNEESFNRQIDQLFFLLYEGSSSAKRLTKRKSPEHFEALWRVKHLRLSARHDVDHGSKSKTDKKNSDIAEAYTGLIGSPIPRTKSDWTLAQIILYGQLVEMLEDLWFES